MNNKLQAKDLINLGLFTVLYFVLGCCVAIPIGFVPIFLPILGALWTLITGIPFMLFLTRVKKFGMVTLMAIMSGLLMGLTGMGYWSFPNKRILRNNLCLPACKKLLNIREQYLKYSVFPMCYKFYLIV